MDYKPGVPKSVPGYDMEVDLVLGKASKFSAYSKSANIYRVLGSMIRNEDIGEYPIEVRVTLKRGAVSRVFKKTFKLLVWGAIPEKSKEEELTGRVIDPRKQANFLRKQAVEDAATERRRPVPFIVEFRPDGVLVIGWDSQMIPPQNLTRIPTTQVAIEADTGVNELRYRHG